MGGKEEYNLVSFPAKTGDMTAMHRETSCNPWIFASYPWIDNK